MLMKECPLCGGKNCQDEPYPSWTPQSNQFITDESRIIHCESNYDFVVAESVGRGECIASIRNYNLIYQFLLKADAEDNAYLTYKFYDDLSLNDEAETDETIINLAKLMKNYPLKNVEKIDKSLLNLSRRFTRVGTRFYADLSIARLVYCESHKGNDEVAGILSFLSELGYVKYDKNSGMYTISANGWQRAFELDKQENVINQGFIAMAFRPETKYISDIFKRVIENKCGYVARRIDEKEHNGQIVPEILFEIARSKFVVVDITQQNLGAYYEAGYAEALKKQVIVCCKKSEFKPHFDIAQKSAVVWEDEADLEERLYKRIEATVGFNK